MIHLILEGIKSTGFNMGIMRNRKFCSSWSVLSNREKGGEVWGCKPPGD